MMFENFDNEVLFIHNVKSFTAGFTNYMHALGFWFFW